MTNQNQLNYTIRQVCELVPISRAALNNLWRCGDGPAKFNIGGRVLIQAADLQAWIAGHVAKSGGAK